MDPIPSFHLLFFLFSQINNHSIYHLNLPSCALANYHPLLTLLSLTHTSFFFPTTYRLFYLCLSCVLVLGYGWKRLDFDSAKQKYTKRVAV